MATHPKPGYALRDNAPVYVDQVANGLACGCVCSHCGARLVARNQGRQRLAHFAHHQAEDCAYGQQTGLHLFAKKIISEHLTFQLPALAGGFGFTPTYRQNFSFNIDPYVDQLPDEVKQLGEYNFSPHNMAVAAVRLEQKTGDIIPDIVLVTADGRQLLVEVAVTHFVDDQKKAKIQALGISCLEIDLSNHPRNLAPAQLEALLIHGVSEKIWIYNAPRQKRINAQRGEYYAAAQPHLEAAHAKEMQYRKPDPTSIWSAARWQNAQTAYRAARQEQVVNAQRQFQEQQRRDAQLYADLLRPVVIVEEVEYQGTAREIKRARQHVPTCPIPERRTAAGKPYASFAADCAVCKYYKGYIQEDQAIICLRQESALTLT